MVLVKDTDNTIQGKIEDVLSKMCGESVTIQGAGRTDAGVHAKGQVANAMFDTEKTCEEICAYLNYYLPEDIEKLVGVAVIGQIPEIEGTEKNYKYWELANGGTISYETNDYASKHEEQK